MAHVFFMKSINHAAQKNQPNFALVKNAHLNWFSPFHPREKNISVSRVTVPKIKFTGVLFILIAVGASNSVSLTKLQQFTNFNFNNLQKICIAQCILRI